MSKRRANEETFHTSKRADATSYDGPIDRRVQFVAYQRALNKQFARWIQQQESEHVDHPWVDGVNDYIRYTKQLSDEFFDVLQAGGSEVSPPASQQGPPSGKTSNRGVTFSSPVSLPSSTPAAPGAAGGAGATPMAPSFTFNAGSTPAPPGGLKFQPTPGSEETPEPSHGHPPTPIMFGRMTPGSTPPTTTLSFGVTTTSPSPAGSSGREAGGGGGAGLGTGSPPGFGAGSTASAGLPDVASPVMGLFSSSPSPSLNLNTSSSSPASAFGVPAVAGAGTGSSPAVGSTPSTITGFNFGVVTSGSNSQNPLASAPGAAAASSPTFCLGVPQAKGTQGPPETDTKASSAAPVFGFAAAAGSSAAAGASAPSSRPAIAFGVPAAAAAADTSSAGEGGRQAAVAPTFNFPNFPNPMPAAPPAFNLAAGGNAADGGAEANGEEEEEETMTSEIKANTDVYDILFEAKARLNVLSISPAGVKTWEARGVGRVTLRQAKETKKCSIFLTTDAGRQLVCSPLLPTMKLSAPDHRTCGLHLRVALVEVIAAEPSARNPAGTQAQETNLPQAKTTFKWTASALQFGTVEKRDTFRQLVEEHKPK